MRTYQHMRVQSQLISRTHLSFHESRIFTRGFRLSGSCLPELSFTLPHPSNTLFELVFMPPELSSPSFGRLRMDPGRLAVSIKLIAG